MQDVYGRGPNPLRSAVNTLQYRVQGALPLRVAHTGARGVQYTSTVSIQQIHMLQGPQQVDSRRGHGTVSTGECDAPTTHWARAVHGGLCARDVGPILDANCSSNTLCGGGPPVLTQAVCGASCRLQVGRSVEVTVTVPGTGKGNSLPGPAQRASRQHLSHGRRLED